MMMSSAPRQRDERYRYFPLQALLENWDKHSDDEHMWVSETQTISPNTVFVRLSDREIRWTANLPEGVTAQLREVLADRRDLFGESTRDDFFTVEARNRAEWLLELNVRADLELKNPIRVEIEVSPEIRNAVIDLAYVLGANTRVSVLEQWGGGSITSSSTVTALRSVVLASDSVLNWSEVYDLTSETTLLGRQQFSVGSDSHLKGAIVMSGGDRIHILSECEARGRGSEITILGASHGSGRQVFNYGSTLFHDVSDSRSRLEFWNVMADQAKAVFDGTIRVTKKGIRTESFQKNFNMLLSKEAVVDSIPKLEIWTDDLACAHGASIAPVNEEQVFYLESRGVPTEEARSMIVSGFTAKVLALVPFEDCRIKLQQTLLEKIGYHGEGPSDDETF